MQERIEIEIHEAKELEEKRRVDEGYEIEVDENDNHVGVCVLCRYYMSPAKRQVLVTTLCVHTFHAWCYRRLEEKHTQCPVCKNPLHEQPPKPQVNPASSSSSSSSDDSNRAVPPTSSSSSSSSAVPAAAPVPAGGSMATPVPVLPAPVPPVIPAAAPVQAGDSTSTPAPVSSAPAPPVIPAAAPVPTGDSTASTTPTPVSPAPAVTRRRQQIPDDILEYRREHITKLLSEIDTKDASSRDIQTLASKFNRNAVCDITSDFKHLLSSNSTTLSSTNGSSVLRDTLNSMHKNADGKSNCLPYAYNLGRLLFSIEKLIKNRLKDEDQTYNESSDYKQITILNTKFHDYFEDLGVMKTRSKRSNYMKFYSIIHFYNIVKFIYLCPYIPWREMRDLLSHNILTNALQNLSENEPDKFRSLQPEETISQQAESDSKTEET